MSFWGKLGKGLLKIAPIAASFIPGVGPLASMAIGGLTGGLSKKLEGGSWKDALLSGGIGAGTSYGLSKIPGIKGIGPSKPDSFVKNAVSNTANKAAGGGFKNTLGKIVKETAKSYLPQNASQGGVINENPQPDDWKGILGGILKQGINQQQQPSMNNRVGLPEGALNYQNPSQGLGPSYSLGNAINQGRQQGIANQPFRGGYDVTTPNQDPKLPSSVSRMPSIYTPMPRKRKQPQPVEEEMAY